ncbi:DNA-binding protein A [Clonorchis sinensis]|uniref:DNA-binding protein A n=1 Tax=Clonorchis sinensis TaxID=79923 RepID=G7YUD2_CLOSI|nr:DNA-binding protein A [Clonorchis sinensis]
MVETASPESDKAHGKASPRKLVEQRVRGEVKWFNVKSGYGFIHRQDTDTDIFVHQSAIARKNPDQLQRSLKEGEEVEFYVVEGEKGDEAYEVTGPDGAPVQYGTYDYMDRGGRGRPFRGRGRPRGRGFRGGYGYDGRGAPRGSYRGRRSDEHGHENGEAAVKRPRRCVANLNVGLPVSGLFAWVSAANTCSLGKNSVPPGLCNMIGISATWLLPAGSGDVSRADGGLIYFLSDRFDASYHADVRPMVQDEGVGTGTAHAHASIRGVRLRA